MGEDERRCVAHGYDHQAAAWWSRIVDGGREYVCGAEYDKLTDRAGWRQDFPRPDN